MSAIVSRVSEVEQHPDAPHLDMVYFEHLAGVVSMKLEDGSPRYKEGDLVVYFTEGTIVPEYILRHGFWDEEKGKGILAGPNGDRVKASNFRGVRSHGILQPIEVSHGVAMVFWKCCGKVIGTDSMNGPFNIVGLDVYDILVKKD